MGTFLAGGMERNFCHGQKFLAHGKIILPFLGSPHVGTYRWLNIGLPFNFQPSEFAKIFLVLSALKLFIEPVFRRYLAQVAVGESPWNTIHETVLTQEQINSQELPEGFLDNLVQAPVLLLVFVDLSVVASFDSDADRVGVISGGSIYPFVWNILLSARNEGLGGTLTTFVGGRELDLKQLLHVPDQYAFSAMIPLGRPVKQLTKLRRNPVESFAVLETFDGAPLDKMS